MSGPRIVQSVALALGLAGASCGAADPGALPRPSKDLPTASTAQPLLGKDGPKTVAVLDTVINNYSKVVADVKPGDTQIKVASVSNTGANVQPGDLVMIIQMQGATIDATNTAAYGTLANAAALGGAGQYEIVGVTAVDAATNTITLDGCSAGGVKNAYAAAGHTQVVRVPQYTTLDIGLLASISALPWDGNKGGVIAAYVQGRTTIGATGSIDASGAGFRGGAIDNTTQAAGMNIPGYRSNDALNGGERGESIAGFLVEYDALYGGRYGRGAAANGGGGGNSHNGGGGGGANGRAAGKLWTGAGVMRTPSNAFSLAWQRDPAYMVGNALSDSSGGGRGGYTFATSDQDATLLGPAQAAWGGNSRRELGGRGGRPVDNDPASRLFLGGGGGAGDGNNNGAGAGGDGGGLIYLVSNDGFGGNGAILANGGDGARTRVGTVGNDAAGGGGGGGTIVVLSGRDVSGVTLRANGGTGGSQFVNANESEGPGGGGGGGYIALSAAQITGLTRTAIGGNSGVSNSTGVTEFNVNGSTHGAVGQPDVAIPFAQGPNLPICIPSDLSVTAVHSGGTVAAGQTIQLTITVRNSGPQPATAATLTDMISAGLGSIAWTCSTTNGATCPAVGTNSIAGVDSIPAGGSLTFVINAMITAGFTGFPIVYNTGVGVPPGFSDPYLGNNTASLTLAANQVPGADLALNVTPLPSPAAPGQPIDYDLQVVNLGPGASAGATLTYNVPAGGTAVLTTVPRGWQCALAAGMVNCTWGAQVPPGRLPAVVVTVTPPASAATVDSSATVTGQGVPDPNAANNTVSTSVPVGVFPPADLSIGLNSTPNPAPQGSDVVYDIRVSNAGPNAATSASLSFQVPFGSTVNNIDAPSGWTCQQAAGNVNCLYGGAVPTGTLPEVKVTVTPAAGTSALVASARVAGQGIADSNLANNLATETNPVGNNPPQADLVLTVTTSPSDPTAGSPVVYTLDVANRGPGTASGAVVTYTLPPGGTIQSIDAPAGWNCGLQDHTLSCWYNSDIAPNTDAPDLVITVLPPPGATSLDVQITATPKGASESNPSDNTVSLMTALATFKLTGGGLSGCTAAPGGSPTPVAAGFFGTLLGLLGRRRRRHRG